jgi:peptidoglycan/LPS O-acetylase OafA/YrhL
METISKKPKILPLTSIRFFAALYVVLFHTIPRIPSQRSHHGMISRIIGLGYVGVSFFFLLSGFILAVVYLRDSPMVEKRKFYLARFARIYPLYLVALLLDLPHFLYTQTYITHRGWEKMLSAILATGGLVQAWSAIDLQGLNQPGWSLSVEALFYLLFPFLGIALWQLRGRLMGPFAVLTYAGGVLLVRFMSRSNLTQHQQAYNPFEHLYVFVLGICLAKFFIWIDADNLRSQALQRYAPSLLLGSLAVFLAIPILDLPIPEMQLQHGVLVPLFALILLAFASDNAIISTLFSSNWLVALGEGSFALYLFHAPMHALLRHPIERFGMPFFLIYLALTLGLSVASTYWLEIPAKRWILRKKQTRSFETEVTSFPIAVASTQ